MSYRPYKPFNANTIGTTISCYTLEKLLNERQDNLLNRKVLSNIMRYFAEVRKVSLSIHDPDTRKYVGKLMLKVVKHFPIDIEVPETINHVIRNIKYAYIKDMMISDVPMHYERKLRPHEIDMVEGWTPWKDGGLDDVFDMENRVWIKPVKPI